MVTSPSSLLRAAGRTSIVLSFIAVLISCFSPFDFGDSSASAESAEVELRFGTTAVSSGGTLDLGNVLVDRYKDVTLAIRNKGSKYLLLTGSPAVAFEGEGASQFELKTTSFSTVLPVGGYQAFKVRFTPASLGVKNVKLKIACGNAAYARFTVTVSCLSYKIPVTGISFNPTALPLMVGETGLLTAAVTPANATYSSVTWASADSSVAAVSDMGLVTGIAVGSTTIAVTTDAGDYSVAFPVSVYTPYNPASWTTTTTTTAYGGRRYHQSVVLNDTLFIIGGNNTSDSFLNDVWKSTDAVNFSQVTTTGAVIVGRRFHACCVFDGKIWLVGGQASGGVVLNDVYSSPDGTAWTEVLANGSAPFPQQYGHCLVTDGEKLYFVGDSSGSYNGVWSTTDGYTWTEVQPTSGTKDSTNRFLNRDSFSCVYLNGNFYVYGGAASGSATCLPEVYTSSDKGKNWTVLSASYSSVARSGSGFAIYGGKMWLAGGAYENSGFTVRNDLLSSADGVTWTEVLADGNAFFSRRNGLTLTVFKNKLYVIGGSTDADAYYSQQDVWQVQ